MHFWGEILYFIYIYIYIFFYYYVAAMGFHNFLCIVMIINGIPITIDAYGAPSEEFELTANTLQARMKPPG